MITVRCLGHIKTSLGKEEVAVEGGMAASELIQLLRTMSQGEPGFDAYNTLAMLEDGDAFVPAAADRMIVDGQKVVVIPFSHGG